MDIAELQRNVNLINRVEGPIEKSKGPGNKGLDRPSIAEYRPMELLRFFIGHGTSSHFSKEIRLMTSINLRLFKCMGDESRRFR